MKMGKRLAKLKKSNHNDGKLLVCKSYFQYAERIYNLDRIFTTRSGVSGFNFTDGWPQAICVVFFRVPSAAWKVFDTAADDLWRRSSYVPF